MEKKGAGRSRPSEVKPGHSDWTDRQFMEQQGLSMVPNALGELERMA